MRSPLLGVWERLRQGSTSFLVDASLGALLAGWAVVDTLAEPALAPAACLPAAVASGSVALRTRAPMAMAAVASVGFLGYGLAPGTSTPLWSFVTILVVAFAVGAQLRGRRRWAAMSVLLLVTYAVQILDAHRSPGELTWGEVFLTPAVLVLGPALAGWLLQRARRQAVDLRRLAAELETERGRYAAAAAEAERSRIARELHDVISHSVSVMVVQAGAAEQLLPPGSPAREQIRAVRNTGKEALAELRRQLGLLGTGGDPAPMPGLDDLPQLARATGATLTSEGVPAGDTSPGLGLTAYRVVQEALTNASRYAAGASVRIRVVHHGDGLELDVANDAGRPADQRGSGRGLAGMRERVELYGGSLDAGPREGGWRVHAWLPRRSGSPR